MNSTWRRAERGFPCPVCGKSDWCLMTANGAVAICPRVEQGSHRYIDGSGYLHVLDASIRADKQFEKRDEADALLPEHNSVMSVLASKMMRACDDQRLALLASLLGVDGSALRLLRVGWNASSGAYSFPMWRIGHRLIGIRLRADGGRKWAIKGSRAGLFMPYQWANPKKGVLICEGPTDTAALLALGYNAVGRPSAMGSHAMIGEAVVGRVVCIICDDDAVGIDSAQKLCVYLKRSGVCSKVGIMVPPAKDAREWVNRGATRVDIDRCVKESLRCDGLFRCQ